MKKEIWLNYLESQVERCRQEGEALSQDCREDEARRAKIQGNIFQIWCIFRLLFAYDLSEISAELPFQRPAVAASDAKRVIPEPEFASEPFEHV